MIFSSKLNLLCVLLILFAGLAVVAIYFGIYNGHSHDNQPSKAEALIDFNRNAIVANGVECSDIGINIFRKHNGTAVDAMIASLFCEGISVTQSMGLGGGFVATLYHKETNTIETLTARERAPLASTENMFGNITEVTGIMAVATPGELKGYWAMHQKYGRVPWRVLIEPSIKLCRHGHIVTSYLADVLLRFEALIKAEPSMQEIFINPATNQVWKANDRIKRPQLAKTLEIIADEGADAMYTANGTVAKLLVDDIRAFGGIVTIDDLVQYSVEWSKPVSTKLRGNFTLYSTPLPSSGRVLAMILNVMDGYEADNSLTFYQRLIETYKFAYAKRTLLGDVELDPQFLNEFTNKTFAEHIRSLIRDNQTFNDPHHYGHIYNNGRDDGTAHISVIARNGDAVSVTSTINSILGARLRSRKTGILLNDEMDDFSRPGLRNPNGLLASPSNFIKPGKRPLSSMCPSIILDSNNNVALLIGGAGGSKITTSTAYSTIRHLWMEDTLYNAIQTRRVHHELLPMHIQFEFGFDTKILSGLRAKGHTIAPAMVQRGFSAVTAISKVYHILEVSADPRRNGSTAIY